MLLSRIIYRSLQRSAIVLVVSVFLLLNALIIIKGNVELDQQLDAQYVYLSNIKPSKLNNATRLFDSIIGWRLHSDAGDELVNITLDYSWQPNIEKRYNDFGVLSVTQQSLVSSLFFELLIANTLLLIIFTINLIRSHRTVYEPWRVFMQLEAWANRFTKKGDFRFFVKSSEYTIVNTIRSLYQHKLDAQHGGNKVEHFVRSQTFLDKSTGLGNRIYFEHRLESLLQQEDDAYGAVLLVHFGALDDRDNTEDNNLRTENQEHEALLNLYANILKEYVDDTRQSLVSRISRSDFAILLPFVDVKEIERIAMNILRQSQKIDVPSHYDKNAICYIGADMFTVRDSSFQILAEADMALRAAQLHGPSGWFVYETDSLPQADVKGSVRWRTAIENALSKNKFKLYFQPVAGYEKVVHHFEVFVRMEDDKQEMVNAKIFLPMARKCGLIPEVDKQMLTLLAKTLDKREHQLISVNIHIDSWLNREFTNWLISFVKKNRSIVNRMIFEISEFELAENAGRLSTIFAALNRYQARITVDQVGLYVLDTSYINLVHLDFIKLHQSIVNNIHERPENQMFIRSLLAITNQKSLPMFAVGVESHQESKVLQRLGVAALQGHYVSQPLLHLPKTNQMLKFAGDK